MAAMRHLKLCFPLLRASNNKNDTINVEFNRRRAVIVIFIATLCIIMLQIEGIIKMFIQTNVAVY